MVQKRYFVFLALFTILVIPAYADPIVKPTSGGTINVSFVTDPVTPNPGDPTQINLNFINKLTNAIQPHIDYKITVMQGANQVFGIPLTHTGVGTVSIPYTFQTAGTYQITVEVDGILFQPIPPETAVFTMNVGNTTPSTTPVNNQTAIPEFGPLSGTIIAISIIGVIIISKRNSLHI